MKVFLNCDYCGKPIWKYPAKVAKHNFCSRQCLGAFSAKDRNPEGYATLKDLRPVSEHMSKLNRELNPKRMTPEVKAKLREARLGTGEGRTYSKEYGRHTHRVEMERILGRKLKPGEVVHHIDGDKRNNSPNNLKVMTRSEHSRYHAKLAAFFSKTGGDYE